MPAYRVPEELKVDFLATVARKIRFMLKFDEIEDDILWWEEEQNVFVNLSRGYKRHICTKRGCDECAIKDAQATSFE